MKKFLLTLTLLATLVPGASAAKKEFTAVASNVDGLPPVVHINAYGVVKRDVNMNPDGSVDTGATRMGQLFLENLYDLIGLSEDFNYHTFITAQTSNYYNSSTYRGKIEQENLDGNIIGYLSQSVAMNTDGLNLLSRKKYKVVKEEWVRWEHHNGYDDHEADGLIRKGFRKYEVDMGCGMMLDVYILHMDAGSCAGCDSGNCNKELGGDNGARSLQMQQLVKYIKENTTTNPVVIIGDTNCRYTRDTVEEDLINSINDDPRFDIHDPWVDFMHDGVYPKIGTPSLMVGSLGEQKGEVVDKVFYINNSDSPCKLTCQGYLHDDSFTYADGSQIADHFPVVAYLTIEDPNAEETENVFEIPDAPTKGAVAAGNTYYIRNVGTGKFLRAGGKYTTTAVLDDYGMRVTLEADGSGYKLKTTQNNGGSKNYISGSGSEFYFDAATSIWTLKQIHDNVYTLKSGGKAVGFKGVNLSDEITENESDANQQWEFLTDADLLHELYYASSSNPKDATFLMKTADFNSGDKENGWTPNLSGSSGGFFRGGPDDSVSLYRVYDSKYGSSKTWSIKQEITNVPAGTYRVSYQALVYNLDKGGNLTFKINGSGAEWTYMGNSPLSWNTVGTKWTNSEESQIMTDFANGQYAYETLVTVESTGEYANKIVIDINKIHTGSLSAGYFDNFRIKCIGLEGSIDQDAYERVRIALEDTKAKGEKIGVNVNNNGIQALYNEKAITGDGWNEVLKCYQNLATATLRIKTLPADYTTALINPSFELYPDYHRAEYNIKGAYPFGWSYSTNVVWDSGVFPTVFEDWNDKRTNGADGDYIYNTWDNEGGGYPIKQTVSLTAGVYKLSAKVATHHNNTVYIFAGDNHAGASGDSDKTGYNVENGVVKENDQYNFVPVELTFIHNGGAPIEIGVVGGNSDGSWNANGDRYYKADDFRLTRIGDADMITGLDMVQTAINDVTARVGKYNKSLDLSIYQEMVDNYTISGNGLKEFYEIYDLFHKIVYAQWGDNVDVTEAIINNSFEFGNLYGWETDTLTDSGVRANSNGTYTAAGCDGNYLFNTYNDGSWGRPISQTMYNVPKGEYELKALFASDNNNNHFLKANDFISDPIVTTAAGTFVEGTLKFSVPEDSYTVVIEALSSKWPQYNYGGGWWFKTDNFRLTRISSNPDMSSFYDALQAAINEAKTVVNKLDAEYKNGWDADIAEYQAIVDNKTLVGDGSKEIAEVFALMRECIFNQNFEGADLTDAILNNSFELGNTNHWTISKNLDDTGARENSNGTYHVDNADGAYVFNTWNGDDWGADISQTIEGLKPGVYRMSALLTSDEGCQVTFFVNDQTSTIFAVTEPDNYPEVEAKKIFQTAEIEFIITEPNSSITFGARSVNHWYKADNFQLTLVAPYQELDKMASAVTTTFQMVPGEEFYILGNHPTEGVHAMCHDFSGKPVLATSNNDITHVVSKAKPFILELDDNGFYLVEKTAASDVRAKAARAATPVYRVEYELGEGNSLTTKITDGNGNVLGFNERNKTFGFESGHTQPAMLMTAAWDDNYTGVDNVVTDENQIVNVYTITGAMVKKNVDAGDALNGLAPGLYILSNGTRVIKH